MDQLIAELRAETQSMNDGRYLLLWPLLGETPMAKIAQFVSVLNQHASKNVVASWTWYCSVTRSVSSFSQYLTACNAIASAWPVRTFNFVQVHFDYMNDLYSSQPLLHWRYQ